MSSKKSLMAKPNTHDSNRVRQEASKTPFVCGDFERDGKEGEIFFFFFSVFSQRRKWGRNQWNLGFFSSGHQNANSLKQGENQRENAREKKSYRFGQHCPLVQRAFFSFGFVVSFTFVFFLNYFSIVLIRFFFFYIFFHLFWFFFSSIFPPHLFCVIVLYNFL